MKVQRRSISLQQIMKYQPQLSKLKQLQKITFAEIQNRHNLIKDRYQFPRQSYITSKSNLSSIQLEGVQLYELGKENPQSCRMAQTPIVMKRCPILSVRRIKEINLQALQNSQLCHFTMQLKNNYFKKSKSKKKISLSIQKKMTNRHSQRNSPLIKNQSKKKKKLELTSLDGGIRRIQSYNNLFNKNFQNCQNLSQRGNYQQTYKKQQNQNQSIKRSQNKSHLQNHQHKNTFQNKNFESVVKNNNTAYCQPITNLNTNKTISSQKNAQHVNMTSKNPFKANKQFYEISNFDEKQKQIRKIKISVKKGY